MQADNVAPIAECVECSKRWLPTDVDRWRAYLACDEDLDQPAEVVIFCPACAEREFGDP